MYKIVLQYPLVQDCKLYTEFSSAIYHILYNKIVSFVSTHIG